MRVLMVIDKMMIGGAEQVFEDLVILLKNEVELTALFITRSEDGQLDRIRQHVPIIELNRVFKFSFLKMFNCARILKRFDVIHVHMRHTYRYISLINKLFRLKKKLIFHDHYGLIEINKSIPFQFPKIFAPFYYIGVSDKLTKWGIYVFGMKNNRVSTLVNLPKNYNFTEANNTYVSNKELVIVGNIKPVKNQSFAIDFAKKINNKIDIIGKVHDLNYFSSLDTSNVHFNHDVNDVSKILKDYRFGIFTSFSESGPLVLLEYLMSGLPFLAVKSGGISDVLSNYLPEYFLDDFVMKDWIDRYHLLNDNYSRINKEIISLILSKEFSRDNYLHKLLSIYELCQ